MADSLLYKRGGCPNDGTEPSRTLLQDQKGFQKAVGAVKSGVTTAFQAVKQTAVTAVTAVRNTVVNVAQKVATVAKTATAAVARPLQRAVNRIPFIKAAAAKVANVLKTTGSYIGNGVAKVTGGIRRAGAAAATWTRTNGAKVAKIGLKAYATYTKTGSRIANFIPVVGKPISKGLGGVAKVANFGSDHINAKLTTKEQKSIKVMNKIQNPLGGVAGKVLNAVLKRDEGEARLLERDGLEGVEVFKRDLIEPLEARSFDDYELFERDVPELYARSIDDGAELKARSWNYEEEA